MKAFDYYAFIDYSESFIGYMIIEGNKIKEIIPKITKFKHYRDTRGRKLYVRHIKKTILRENVKASLFKLKIKKVKDSPEIYSDIAVFLKKYDNCIIFISVDDMQYSHFEKFVKEKFAKTNFPQRLQTSHEEHFENSSKKEENRNYSNFS